MKIKIKTILLSIIISFSATSYAVTLNSMNKAEVTQTLIEKTLETIPLSTIKNKLVADRISIYFRKDGHVNGRLSKETADQPQNDQGTWVVNEDGALCISWQHWFAPKAFCDYVFDVKNSLLFTRKDGEFVSLALKKNILDGNKIME